jgi:hypothetical protein
MVFKPSLHEELASQAYNKEGVLCQDQQLRICSTT